MMVRALQVNRHSINARNIIIHKLDNSDWVQTINYCKGITYEMARNGFALFNKCYRFEGSE